MPTAKRHSNSGGANRLSHARPSDSKRIFLSVALSKKTLAQNRQTIVIKYYFESVLLKAQGGRLETNAVQRPILTVLAVSEGRSPRLNPFETKRKKGPVKAHHRFRQVKVADR